MESRQRVLGVHGLGFRVYPESLFGLRFGGVMVQGFRVEA